MATFQSERELLAQLEGLFLQKKFDAGLTQADVVLKQFPASFQLKFLKYRFLRELQRSEEAMFQLREMHAMFGENIMILRELADMLFRQQQFPESLVYYKKLLFLDSFNSQAQERVKHLQGILESSLAEKLADTQVELAGDASRLRPSPAPVAATEAAGARSHEGTGHDARSHEGTGHDARPAKGTDVEITFEGDSMPGRRLEEAPAPPPPAEDLHFETESAAELYFKQGLYRESLAIYKNLFEKTGRTDFFLKIKAILLLLRTERSNQVIERLQRLLLLIQERGKQVV